jgi:hypothetical protein
MRKTEFSGVLNFADSVVPRVPVNFNDKRYGANYFEDVGIQFTNIAPGTALKLKFSFEGGSQQIVTLLDDRGYLTEIRRNQTGEIDFTPAPNRLYYARVQSFVGSYGNAPEPFKLEIEADDNTGIVFGKYEGQVPYYKFAELTPNGAYNHHDFPDAGYSANTPLVFQGNNAPVWVYGGDANDLLTGFDVNYAQIGNGSKIDQFAGGGGNDTFAIANAYGQQIDSGFAIIWDFVIGEDRIEVTGSRDDYFFVRDDSTWLDNQSFLLKPIDTSAIANTILARRDPIMGAVMVAAISDAAISLDDLSFLPIPQN